MGVDGTDKADIFDEYFDEVNYIGSVEENIEGLYFDYHEGVCPICGGRIKHPYTGLVTMEQIEEDARCCQWIEVVDEGGGTIGFRPICKNSSIFNHNL